MAKDVFHVVPAGNAWAVKKEGNERPASNHDTQKAAIDWARETAQEGDAIVVHRADGSIRERTTYTGSSNGGGGDRDDSNRPEAHDIWSTGTRVHWSPILAGVVCALAVSAVLTSLAAAIGLTATDRMDNVNPRTVAIIAGITWMVIMLASLFFGGYVATRMTTRETKWEAVLIGVLVWGATSALISAGIVAGGNTALNATRTAANVRAERPFWEEMGWTEERMRERMGTMSEDEQRRYEQVRNRARESAQNVDPRATAWWIFAGMALSVMAAMGGALVGAGPEVTRSVFFYDAPATRATASPRESVAA